MKEELPQGWTSATLDQLGTWGSGGTPLRSRPEFFRDGTIPWLKIGDLNDGLVQVADERITELGLNSSAAKLLQPGTLLVAMYGSIGKLGITGIDCATNQAIAHCTPAIDLWYMFWLLRSKREALAERGKGGTQANISQSVLRSFAVPVAPLAEQRRIVIAVETLLSRVDAARKHLARARNLVKGLRQAVVAAAYSGRLTEDLRRRADTWAETTVGDLAESIQYGYTASATSWRGGPRFVRITDIQQGRVEWSQVPGCTITTAALPRFRLHPGDILFARSGATTGKSFLVRECPEAIFASYLIRLRVRPDIVSPEFLHLFFQTPQYWQAISENLAGNAQPNCNASKLSSIRILVPSRKEQEEIVRRAGALFSILENVDQRAVKTSKAADAVPQSLLSLAFTGELVPTEAELARQEGRDYEPAAVLIERIKRERSTGLHPGA